MLFGFAATIYQFYLFNNQPQIGIIVAMAIVVVDVRKNKDKTSALRTLKLAKLTTYFLWIFVMIVVFHCNRYCACLCNFPRTQGRSSAICAKGNGKDSHGANETYQSILGQFAIKQTKSHHTRFWQIFDIWYVFLLWCHNDQVFKRIANRTATVAEQCNRFSSYQFKCNFSRLKILW